MITPRGDGGASPGGAPYFLPRCPIRWKGVLRVLRSRNPSAEPPVLPWMKRFLLASALFALPALAWAVMDDTYFFEAPHDGETALEAELELALGQIHLRRNDGPALFEAEVRLKSDDVRPRFDFETDGRTGKVWLGLDGEGKSKGFKIKGFDVPEGNAWDLFLSDEVTLDLDLDVGMAAADLDLTGLRVRRLGLDCGMAEATLRFGEANPVVAERLEIDAGMAQFKALGLGNARFERFEFDGGAGEFMLDFTGGALPAGARADVEVGMAKLEVIVPKDRPIVLHAPDSWLAKVVVPNGYTKRGEGVWHSASVRSERDAERAFQLHIEAAAGKVDVAAR